MQITTAHHDPMLARSHAVQQQQRAGAPARSPEQAAPSPAANTDRAPMQTTVSSPPKATPEQAKKMLASLKSTLPPAAHHAIDRATTQKGAGADHHQPTSGPQMYTVTMKGLKAEWGTDNPLYDLTGSGTVDVFDMLELVRNGGTMEVPMQEVDTPLTLKGLIAAWGTNNPRYDLTGNGTVGIEDLLAFIRQYGDEE